MVCGKRSHIVVDDFCYRQWRGGELIQNAFPSMTADEREVLVSGTHGECFYALFGDDTETDDH